MNRHLLFFSIFIFIGILFLSGCGNDKKSHTDTQLVKEKDSADTQTATIPDSTQNSTSTAEAAKVKEDVEEVKEEKKQTSFNPPHIPVFKEEKVEKKKVKETAPRKKKPNSDSTTKTLESKKVAEVTPKKKAPSAKPVSKNQKTEIVWRRNFYSFGDIIQGDTVYFKFEFTNIGDHPLEIESATASCGCTHPSFSFIPVESNEKGEIKGMYISDETKKGTQNAMIMVKANTDPPIHKLYIDGNVLLPVGNSKDDNVESKGN